MSRRLSVFLAALGLGASIGPALGDWRVPAAEARYRLVPVGKTVADTGYVEVCADFCPATNIHVRLFTRAGTEVGSQILWAAEGEPVKVLFDASGGDNELMLYAAAAPSGAPPAWQATSGVYWETRRRAEGDPDTWAKTRQICIRSSPLLGRSPVSHVFAGIHPHGPSHDFASIFRGFFLAPAAGVYEFATISADASCLFIDGAMVANWPGWHDPHGGRHGQHKGAVRLAVGKHAFEYLNIKRGGGFNVAMAWKPPGLDRFEIMPEAAFTRVRHFRGAAAESRPHNSARVRASWRLAAHAMAENDVFVSADFQALPPVPAGPIRWRFHDGVELEGEKVSRTFVRESTVTVRVGAAPTAAAEFPMSVLIRPVWSQPNEWPADLFAEQARWLLDTPIPAMPVDDLRALLAMADRVDHRPLLSRFGERAVERAAEFAPADAPLFLRLAFHFQRAEVQRYGVAERAFAAGAALARDNSDALALNALHRAGMLIHVLERFDDAERSLETIAAERLPETERRLCAIYRGDLQLARGRIDAARAAYRSVGNVTPLTDRAYAVRRRARIETATDYIARGEIDEAERILREIEWETPGERMASETGLLLTRIDLARREVAPAAARCRRLLRAAEADARRPDILHLLGEIETAAGHGEAARAVFAELESRHPYTEAAARARTEWARTLAAPGNAGTRTNAHKPN